MKISNEHIPTPSAIIYDDELPDELPVQHFDREEDVHEMYSDYKLRRRRTHIQLHHAIRSRKNKRSHQRNQNDQRRIRIVQVKDNMKHAVKMAKAAGKAIEYKGPLNRANIVSSLIIITSQLYH